MLEDNQSLEVPYKARTPSGQFLENPVSKLRTLFSPENAAEIFNTGQKGELVNGVQVLDCVHSVLAEGACGSKTSSVTNNIKEKSLKVKTCRLRNLENINETSADSDSENYFTPPATPKGGSNNSQHLLARLLHQSKRLKRAMSINGTEEMDGQTVDADTSLPSQQIEKMMKDYKGEQPQTIDIQIVHSLFKQMEGRLIKLEARSNVSMDTDDNAERQMEKEDQLESLIKDVEKLKINTRTLKSAALKMTDEISESVSRIDKLELNNNRKMAMIVGLYTNGKKNEVIEQIENFLLTTIGVSVDVDDYFEIGINTPRSKVIILQSLRDKMQIMKYKKLLKEQRNEDRKPYFINDYLPAKQTEDIRRDKNLFKRNEEKEERERSEMTYEEGVLLIDGQPFEPAITPPSIHSMLSVNAEKMDLISKIPICKGNSLEKSENIFTGYTMAVDSLQAIQEAYIKMRLCNPKARHIICAYIIPGQEDHIYKGSCDDGEHGAGETLLNYMLEHDLTCRVIFITRIYSGKKIGKDRFTMILQAANSCMQTYPRNVILDTLQTVPEELKRPDKRPTKQKENMQSYDEEYPPMHVPTNPPTLNYNGKKRRQPFSPEERLQKKLSTEGYRTYSRGNYYRGAGRNNYRRGYYRK